MKDLPLGDIKLKHDKYSKYHIPISNFLEYIDVFGSVKVILKIDLDELLDINGKYMCYYTFRYLFCKQTKCFALFIRSLLKHCMDADHII